MLIVGFSNVRTEKRRPRVRGMRESGCSAGLITAVPLRRPNQAINTHRGTILTTDGAAGATRWVWKHKDRRGNLKHRKKAVRRTLGVPYDAPTSGATTMRKWNFVAAVLAGSLVSSTTSFSLSLQDKLSAWSEAAEDERLIVARGLTVGRQPRTAFLERGVLRKLHRLCKRTTRIAIQEDWRDRFHVRCHAPQVLKTSALNGFANGRAFHAARPLSVPGQKACGGTQDSCGLGTRISRTPDLVAQRGTRGRHLSSSRRHERKACRAGEPKTSWSVPTLGIITGDAHAAAKGQ
jgi:hypothetical protein